MKKIKILKVCLFIVVIFSLSILSIIFMKVDSTFIVAEQRYEASFPKLYDETQKIQFKKFFSEFENFFSDRFFQRNNLIKIKTIFDLNVVKKKHISDLILSKNGDMALRFREKELEVNSSNLEKNILKWGKIKKDLDKLGSKLIVILIPDQSFMFADKYPKGSISNYESYKKTQNILMELLERENIDYIDMFPIVKDKREEYYVKGDHHPNFKFTMEAYEQLIFKSNHLGIRLTNVIDDSEIKENKKYFYGSHSRKLFNLLIEEYKMQYLLPKKKIEFNREDLGKESSLPIFKETNYYGSYMGGDLAETVIETNRMELPNILVAGDSTTNTLETILWMNSNRFTSLDFRKYDKMGLIEYVNNNPQDLVVVSVISEYYYDLERIMN